MRSSTTSRKSFVISIVALCLAISLVLLIVMTQAFSAPISLFAMPTPLPRNGLIAFEREVSGNRNDIYVVEADGSNERPLVNNSQYEGIGEWSPDGTKLLYIVNDGNTEKDGLYTVDPSGINQQLLTNMLYCCYYNASWSADGQYAVSMHHNTGGLMYTINSDGSNQLEIYPDNPRSPDWLYFNNYYWSPDGKTFLFTPIKDAGGEDERREIYAMNFDGSDIRPLVIGASDRPAWSPDGTQIAFQNRREGNWDIYVMNPDGTNQRRLSDSPVYDQNPLWSPDGRYIAFESGRVGATEIYVMDADGTNERRLTENYVTDNLLTWSPDGTQLLFSSVSPEKRADWEPTVFDVYAVNTDGTNLRRLFQSHGGPVSWQPLP